MAAGFQFDGNNFKFYCHYGAADRFAEGTFSVNHDTIVLKSNKVPGNDFNIVKQATVPGQYTVKVSDPNKFLIQYAVCLVIEGDKTARFTANKEGIIHFEAHKNAKVYIKHDLYPDIPTLLKDEQSTVNYFEVTLKPSLEQLSFKGIDLFLKEDGLTWHPNYFIGAENVRFEKEN